MSGVWRARVDAFLKRYDRPWKILVLSALVWCATIQAIYIMTLTRYSHPADVGEVAQVRTTQALVEHRNPWAPEFAPLDYNCYGFLYPWLASKILPQSHRGIEAHRALSISFLLLASILLGLAIHKLSQSSLAAAFGALAAMAGYLFSIIPSARCDGLASLCFAMPIALVAISGSVPALILASLVAGLGFYAKPYVILAIPCLALVLWLQDRKMEACAVLGLSSSVALGVFIWVRSIWPGYFALTSGIHMGAATLQWAHVGLQSAAYLLHFAWPWVMVLLIGLRGGPGPEFKPWSIAFLAMLALLSLWLGRHVGAFITYYLQLLTPLGLLAVAALRAPRQGFERLLTLGMLLAALAGTFDLQHLWLKNFQRVQTQSWDRAEGWVNRAQKPWLPAELDLAGLRLKKTIYENGQSQYLELTPNLKVHQAWQAHLEAWQDKLVRGECDLVFSSVDRPLNLALLGRYVQVEELCFPMPLQWNASCFGVYVLKGAERTIIP